MGKDGWQQRVQVDIKRTEGAVPSDHRTESVGLCWTEKQRHALPAGMTAKISGKKHDLPCLLCLQSSRLQEIKVINR